MFTVEMFSFWILRVFGTWVLLLATKLQNCMQLRSVMSQVVNERVAVHEMFTKLEKTKRYVTSSWIMMIRRRSEKPGKSSISFYPKVEDDD